MTKQERDQLYYLVNREKIIARETARYQENKTEKKLYVQNWCAKNPQKVAGYQKKWSQNNKGYRSALSAKRRALVRVQVIAKSYILEVLEIYKNRPAEYHVDHCVPLQGKNVCGLHVPWNLQYLPGTENRKKTNKCQDS